MKGVECGQKKKKKHQSIIRGTFPIFSRSLLENEHECSPSWRNQKSKNLNDLNRKRLNAARPLLPNCNTHREIKIAP